MGRIDTLKTVQSREGFVDIPLTDTYSGDVLTVTEVGKNWILTKVPCEEADEETGTTAASWWAAMAPVVVAVTPVVGSTVGPTGPTVGDLESGSNMMSSWAVPKKEVKTLAQLQHFLHIQGCLPIGAYVPPAGRGKETSRGARTFVADVCRVCCRRRVSQEESCSVPYDKTVGLEGFFLRVVGLFSEGPHSS